MMNLYQESGKVTDEIWALNQQRNDKIDSPDYKGKQKKILTREDLEYVLANGIVDTSEFYGRPNSGSGGTSTSGKEYGSYTVKKGDSLSTIANKLKSQYPNLTWGKIAEANGISSPYTIYAGQVLKIPKYKTGGLADFTGPAWLDGSKSKPELVLNAKDTENFIMLKDILSGVLNNTSSTQKAGGDNYYDIDIQVDQIANDYDVDRMADRIREKIYDDSTYRNVNTINFLR